LCERTGTRVLCYGLL
nr:immunoglobulin heavy chain junction region [Mus musculus]